VSVVGSDAAINQEATPSWVRHVVVPADGSEASLHGLALAADVARRTGARVTVLFVRHEPAGTGQSQGSTGGSVEEALEEMEAEVRAAAARAFHRGVSWDLLVRSGSPGEQVLEAVKDTGANLVIIGSDRHSPVHNVLLGSTTAYLTSHSPVPVLVARPADG
jgi:nucleotide-binding universal stress UspA family protein